MSDERDLKGWKLDDFYNKIITHLNSEQIVCIIKSLKYLCKINNKNFSSFIVKRIKNNYTNSLIIRRHNNGLYISDSRIRGYVSNLDVKDLLVYHKETQYIISKGWEFKEKEKVYKISNEDKLFEENSKNIVDIDYNSLYPDKLVLYNTKNKALTNYQKQILNRIRSRIVGTMYDSFVGTNVILKQTKNGYKIKINEELKRKMEAPTNKLEELALKNAKQEVLTEHVEQKAIEYKQAMQAYIMVAKKAEAYKIKAEEIAKKLNITEEERKKLINN